MEGAARDWCFADKSLPVGTGFEGQAMLRENASLSLVADARSTVRTSAGLRAIMSR